MKVLNEEPDKNRFPDTFILILNTKEAIALSHMVSEACKASPRKKTWRAIMDVLDQKLSCF